MITPPCNPAPVLSVKIHPQQPFPPPKSLPAFMTSANNTLLPSMLTYHSKILSCSPPSSPRKLSPADLIVPVLALLSITADHYPLTLPRPAAFNIYTVCQRNMQPGKSLMTHPVLMEPLMTPHVSSSRPSACDCNIDKLKEDLNEHVPSVAADDNLFDAPSKRTVPEA